MIHARSVHTCIRVYVLSCIHKQQFNFPLFRKLGDLGLLGLTVPTEYGGSGLDATAVAIAHEEISAADPAFCLSFLAHSLLFVNNLAQVQYMTNFD